MVFGDDQPGIRTAYVEIVSPSRKHEHIKTVAARLVELYALEVGGQISGPGKIRAATPDQR